MREPVAIMKPFFFFFTFLSQLVLTKLQQRFALQRDMAIERMAPSTNIYFHSFSPSLIRVLCDYVHLFFFSARGMLWSPLHGYTSIFKINNVQNNIFTSSIFVSNIIPSQPTHTISRSLKQTSKSPLISGHVI